MSNGSKGTDEQPADIGQRRVEARLRDLLARIWRAVLANKLLISSVILLGFAQAFFTKLPLILIKPLMKALGADRDVSATPHGNWGEGVLESLEKGFQTFCCWVRDLFGLEWGDAAATVLGCAVVAAILGILGGLALYGVTVTSRYFATKIVVDLRNEVAGHLLRLPMRFYSKRRMGDLISTITTDTAILTRAFTLACDNVVVEPLMILNNLFLLLLCAPQAAWLLVVMVPAMALPMIRTGRKIHKSSSKSLAAMGDATESMNQMLGGIRTVKAFQLESQRQAEFEASNANYLRRTKRMLQAKGFSQGFLFGSYQLGFAVLVGIAGWLVIEQGTAFTTIALISLPLATTYNHVKRLARSYNTMMESVGAMEGIESLLRVKPDLSEIEGGTRLEAVRGEVDLENVAFAYEEEPVLSELSFHVEPGQTVAFVGPSGAGKSTAMDLLARFHDPLRGRVMIDGHDLRELDLKSYRRHVAMVSQQPFLFNTSIYENILYGRPEATENEVFEAARQAQIHDFVQSLPRGYQTLAGERGSNLSGGQMQRITIARAILRNPAILFLDEATSALDSESEGAVQSALDNLMRGRTSFIIAHRLSTVRKADLILVMDRGRLVGQGRHEDLVRQGGLYSRLSQLQKLDV